MNTNQRAMMIKYAEFARKVAKKESMNDRVIRTLTAVINCKKKAINYHDLDGAIYMAKESIRNEWRDSYNSAESAGDRGRAGIIYNRHLLLLDVIGSLHSVDFHNMIKNLQSFINDFQENMKITDYRLQLDHMLLISIDFPSIR